jgi:hypothetical protein
VGSNADAEMTALNQPYLTYYILYYKTGYFKLSLKYCSKYFYFSSIIYNLGANSPQYTRAVYKQNNVESSTSCGRN